MGGGGTSDAEGVPQLTIFDRMLLKKDFEGGLQAILVQDKRRRLPYDEDARIGS